MILNVPKLKKEQVTIVPPECLAGSGHLEFKFRNSDIDPSIIITRDEIENGSGISGGPTIIRVDITDGDDKTARFWIRADCHNGRPRLDVTSYRPFAARDIIRRIIGKWCDFRHPSDKFKAASKS